MWSGKSLRMCALTISLICTYTCILCQLLEHHLTASGLISFHTIRDKFTGAIVHVNLLKTLLGLKRISEAGTQQLLLNVYDELPVLWRRRRELSHVIMLLTVYLAVDHQDGEQRVSEA